MRIYAERHMAMHYRVASSGLKQGAFGDGVLARLFNGAEHGLGTISLMLGEVQPGSRVRLHRHEYEELFVLHQGTAMYHIGDTSVTAQAGDIVIVPAGVPHSFESIGDAPLLQTAVHATDALAIEWLE